jgi:hypothetical protein
MPIIKDHLSKELGRVEKAHKIIIEIKYKSHNQHYEEEEEKMMVRNHKEKQIK